SGGPDSRPVRAASPAARESRRVAGAPPRPLGCETVADENGRDRSLAAPALAVASVVQGAGIRRRPRSPIEAKEPTHGSESTQGAGSSGVPRLPIPAVR